MKSLCLVVTLVALSQAATVEKRDFDPSPLMGANELPAEARHDMKTPDEDPQGNLYYYYHPEEGEVAGERKSKQVSEPGYESRDDGGSYTYYDPIEAGDGSSSYGTTGGTSTGGGGSSYAAVGGGYSTGSGGYGGGGISGKDTSHFLKISIPLFILGAIMLGFSSLTFGLTGRRKRSLEPTFAEKLENEVEKTYNIYLNAFEAEECRQRIACEAGHYAKSLPASLSM